MPRVFRLVLPLTVLASCAPRQEGALRFTIELDPRLRADCVSFVGSANGTRAIAGFFVRSPGRHTYTVGVPRQDLAPTLAWQARAVTGSCGDSGTWKTTSLSAEKSVSFPESGVKPDELRLDLPGPDLDADRDTWVDVMKNGEDCNDADVAINPGAAQACGSPVDTNCDGRLFCDDPSCSNDAACQRPATRIEFSGAPGSVVNHECSGEVRVTTTDDLNVSAAVARSTTVTLAASDAAAAGLELFADPACTTPLAGTTLTLAFGQSSVSFSFRPRSTGPLALQASTPALGTTSFTTTVTEQPIAELRALPQAVTVASTACSQPVELSAVDSQGRPTRATSAVDVTAMVEPLGTTGVEFFTAAGCAPSSMGTPRLTPGTSTTSVWVRATQATPAGMPLTVRFGAAGVTTPAVVAVTVTSGAPTRVEFREQGVSIDRAVCSTQDVELRLFDAQGNRAAAGPTGAVVTLNVAPPAGGSLSFFTASGCGSGQVTTSVTIPAGQDAQRLFLNASVNGRYTVTASLNAAPSPPLEVSVAAMPPTALVFPNQAVPVATTAGACSRAVRVQTRETSSPTSALSGVTGPTVVSVETTPAGRAELFSDSNCTMPLASGSQLTFLRGVSEQTFYFRGRLAGAFVLEATRVSGDFLAAAAPPQPAVIDPGLTTRFEFTTPLAVTTTADGCTPAFGVLARDDFNNPTRASGFRLAPAATPALTDGGVVFFAGATCTSPASQVDVIDGGASFWARARVARDYSVTAQSTAPSALTRFPDGGVQSVTLTVTPAAPTVLAVTAQPPVMVTAGTCHPVTIERRDAFGNPSPGAAQVFTATPTNGSLTAHADSAGCMAGTLAAGLQFAANQASATFFVRGRTAGMGAVTVSGMGMATTNLVSVVPGAAARLEFDSLPATSTVGVCATGTVRRLDAESNLTTTGPMGTVTASGATMNLRLGAACPASMTMTTQALVFGSATSASFAFDPRASGTLTFTASGAGLASAMASTTVGAGAVASVNFVSPPSTPQLAAACIPLTLEALDASGVNRVAATASLSNSLGGEFFSMASCGASPNPSVMIPANGTATVYYRPTATGMHTLTATVAGVAPATATFPVSPGTPTQLARTPDFAASSPSGSCVSFTLERRDAAGNPTTLGGPLSVTAALTGTASTGPFAAELYPMGGCMGAASTGLAMVSIADGAATGTFGVRPRVLGDLTLALTSPLSQNPMNTSTSVVAGPLASLVFTTTPPASVLVGSCTLVTLAGRDAATNATALSADVTLSMMGSSATFHRQADCMDTPNATLPASTMNTTADFYVKPTAAGADLLLTATAGSLSVNQAWTFTAPAATSLRFQGTAPVNVTRLSCTGPYRFESTDGTNPVASGQNRVITFGGANVQWFSDGTCSTPITTTSLGAGDQQTPTFWFVAFGEGSTTLTGTAAPALMEASAPITVMGNPGALSLGATASSNDLEFRGCVALTLERRVMGTAFSGNFPTALALTNTGSGAAGVTLHAASDCTGTQLPSVTIPASQASVVVYAAGHSAERQGTGPAFTVATANVGGADAFAGGFGSGANTFNVHPAVRRGSCTIENGESSSATSAVQCTIRPPLPMGARTRSFFTFQAVTENAPSSADSGAVNCVFSGDATTLVCERSGTSQVVQIAWQVVSMAQGLQVGHFDGEVTGMGPAAVDITSAGLMSTGNAFVLFGLRTSGSLFSFDDNVTAELTSATQVTLSQPMMGWPTTTRYSLQVVQLASVEVLRGATAGTGASFTATVAAPAVGTSSVLLHSQRVTGPGTTPPAEETAICKYRVRGALTSDTQLTFSRAAGSANTTCTNVAIDAVAWERLSFPASVASVQSFPAVTINGNTTSSGAQSIGSVPLDRTWSFLGGQGTGGQAGGETNFSSDDRVGYAQARVTYGTGSITLVRGDDGGGNNSTYGLFVVTFAP
jgi:hypothetical protein